ncbi:Carbon-nitrogen hydrolase [Coemansia sp. RSA 2322]|nr:Carbon-nitrogen hydrolase [Coemansia sp. RSA 2322]
MPDHLAHGEVDGYEDVGGMKLSGASAHVIAAVKAVAEDDGDYDMADHQHHDHHGSAHGNGEEYAAEHEYADYDMTEVDVEHQGAATAAAPGASEYADNVDSTHAGSILATQDNAEEQLLDEDAQQGAEYAYEQDEAADESGKAHELGIDDGGQDELADDDHDHHVHDHHRHDHHHHQHEQPDHQQGMYEEEQDDHGSHLYSGSQDDAAALEYSMMSADAADTSPLATLTRAISSGGSQHAQGDGQGGEPQAGLDRHEHGGVAGGAHLHSPSLMRFKQRPPMLDTSAAASGSQAVTPIKRQHSAHSGDGSSASRLKSKVWSWYDISNDGQRQCRFCAQKYGRLTATTILARHYHNRHDPNPPPIMAATPTHRSTAPRLHSASQSGLSPQHQHLNLSPVGQGVYSQAAAAAAVAAAAVAAAPDAQASHLFHPQANGASSPFEQAELNGGASDDILRTVSEATEHGESYEDSQLAMQEGYSSLMTAPLSRISLAPARRAVAAVAQFCAQGDMQKNLQTCVELIYTASKRGARMLFLPESSDFISETRAQPAQQAQGLDGPFMKEIQLAAKNNNIWVSIGIHEQQAEGMPFNTNAVVSDNGTLVSIYRKLHLFDVNVKDGPRMVESSVTARGDRVPDVVSTPVGQLGLSVCYDMRFPELAQLLRLRGAQSLCYPSAFTEMTGAAHWEVMLRARAIETQTYVFAAAQIGKHNAKRSSYGDAMIVDPWGAVVARCSRNSSEPTLAIAEVSFDFLDKVRRDMPVFSHKRADMFSQFAS